jgi:hypothetical protein
VEVCGGIVAEEGTAVIEDAEQRGWRLTRGMKDWSDRGAWRWKTWIVTDCRLSSWGLSRLESEWCRRRALQQVSEGEHQVTKGGTMGRIPVMEGLWEGYQ